MDDDFFWDVLFFVILSSIASTRWPASAQTRMAVDARSQAAQRG